MFIFVRKKSKHYLVILVIIVRNLTKLELG